jgi:hypothetical protein
MADQPMAARQRTFFWYCLIRSRCSFRSRMARSWDVILGVEEEAPIFVGQAGGGVADQRQCLCGCQVDCRVRDSQGEQSMDSCGGGLELGGSEIE